MTGTITTGCEVVSVNFSIHLIKFHVIKMSLFEILKAENLSVT